MIEIIKAKEHHIPDICNLWLEFMRYTGDSDPFFAVDEGSKAGFEKDYLRPHMEPGKNWYWWLWTWIKWWVIYTVKLKTFRIISTGRSDMSSIYSLPKHIAGGASARNCIMR